MNEERPDDAHEPDRTAGPDDGDAGLEAQRAPDPDAPFHGLRSAADIFGAPRGAEDWPSRRERREAERAAKETGAPLPEPFEPAPVSAPAQESGPVTPGSDTGAAALDAGPADDPDAAVTQAIAMPPELAAPSENPTAVVEQERATLHDRIPPAAPVPPPAAAPHPSSIQLPTAQSHRDDRASEARAIDEERRRVDPFGQGRGDVDWLGRATGSHPEPDASLPSRVPPSSQVPPALPVPPAVPVPPALQVPPALGVENTLPPTDQPPSFTELLRIDALGTDAGSPFGETGGHDRPFDWAIRDDQTPEVPTALTGDRFDTTTLVPGAWSLADESEDEDVVVSGEVPTPVSGSPVVPAGPVVPPDAAATTVTPDVPATTVTPDAAATTALPAADVHPDDQATTALPAPTSALPAAHTPWWAEPDATVPPTAMPPLVEPAGGGAGQPAYPAHLPPAVGQGLDAITGIRRRGAGVQGAGVQGAVDDDHADAGAPTPERLPSTAPDDLDQSEWTGRETSDTSAIKDLFGTAAVDQLGSTGYDPHDTGTRMMPSVPSANTPSVRSAVPLPPAASAPAQQGIINEQFARLQGEGKRGKQLLIGGAILIIVVLLVAVFLLTRWILGNRIDEHAPVPTKSPAAAAAPSKPKASAPATTPATPATTQQAAGLQFASTPAAPGEHPWTDLAGGECLSPFANAWAETYTVVDCASPHVAQLTARLPVTASQYPGPDALAAQASEQCQSSSGLNASAAAAFGDVQVQGSYAPDQATWDRGDVFISCFVTRSSGGTLTGSLAPSA
ncbi:hypothetical protein [Curtobacterium sp. ISL-83]|uniref:hypothetical protein n=1 Tax=Curtobacterium sp. ISL-83 TaxID=2819145 RepID=UPI001BEA8388|nr:hypothetical protein [Curtobacterium sp. ISL-83]MBT2502684.1 hypothetical protein [Curtobacterium sp. ISL-83]